MPRSVSIQRLLITPPVLAGVGLPGQKNLLHWARRAPVKYPSAVVFILQFTVRPPYQNFKFSFKITLAKSGLNFNREKVKISVQICMILPLKAKINIKLLLKGGGKFGSKRAEIHKRNLSISLLEIEFHSVLLFFTIIYLRIFS
jgi:hypothetical protein